MMSNLMIQMNYTQAMAQANELSKIAGNIKNLTEEELAKIISDISSSWEGENARSYLAKVNILKSNLMKTAASIDKAARSIREMATNIYQAELEAENIAEVRTYGH